MVDNASHTLASSATAKPTFNVEEEDVVIRNGWTPKKVKKKITAGTRNKKKNPFRVRASIFVLTFKGLIVSGTTDVVRASQRQA